MAGGIFKLSALACSKAVKDGAKRELADGGGLYLGVSGHGHASWRYKFRLGGKEETFSIGVRSRVNIYPKAESGNS